MAKKLEPVIFTRVNSTHEFKIKLDEQVAAQYQFVATVTGVPVEEVISQVLDKAFNMINICDEKEEEK